MGNDDWQKDLTEKITTVIANQESMGREIKGLRGEVSDLKDDGCVVGKVHQVTISKNEQAVVDLYSKFDALNSGSQSGDMLGIGSRLKGLTMPGMVALLLVLRALEALGLDVNALVGGAP